MLLIYIAPNPALAQHRGHEGDCGLFLYTLNPDTRTFVWRSEVVGFHTHPNPLPEGEGEGEIDANAACS